MRSSRSVAREISYASSARTPAGRAVIRSLENLTGRLGLIRRARGYDREVAAGRDFWEVMVERYGLELEVAAGSLANLPAEGPLVVISKLASHLHQTLRLALLVGEFKTRVGTPVPVAIGRPLDPAELRARAGDARQMMDYLRAEAYRLSPRPIADLSYGFEFEDLR